MPENEKKVNPEMDHHEFMFYNGKRTYDEMQEVSLKAAKDAQTHVVDVNALSLQAMQNAITFQHATNAQMLNHQNLAADRQWNLDEVSQLADSNAVLSDAVAAKMITALKMNGYVVQKA